MSAATDVAVLVRAHARVGEGPMWDSERGVLHWVDILGQAIHTSDLSTGATTRRRGATRRGGRDGRLLDPGRRAGAQVVRRFQAGLPRVQIHRRHLSDGRRGEEQVQRLALVDIRRASRGKIDQGALG
jgi:hypothetical protein